MCMLFLFLFMCLMGLFFPQNTDSLDTSVFSSRKPAWILALQVSKSLSNFFNPVQFQDDQH
jgi:hypothetical protein